VTAPNQLKQANVSFSSNGDNTVIAASTGNALHVWKISLTIPAAQTLLMKDGASTTLATYTFAAAGAMAEETAGTFPLFRTLPGNAFIINLSSGVAIVGSVWYSLS
jgi:hypothetical protein